MNEKDFKNVSKNIEIMVKDIYKQGYNDALDDENMNIVTEEKQTVDRSSTQEKLMETLMFLEAKCTHLECELKQCKEDKQEIPGYCMDCKNLSYTARYDNITKKGYAIDFCKYWSKEDHDGNTIVAETVADGYCHMFEPKTDEKDDTTGTWSHGVCDNCGYDWSKDAPIASVPEYCPKCGQKKAVRSMS